VFIEMKSNDNSFLSRANVMYDKNLVHCLPSWAVRLTAYLNFCSGCMLKGFGLILEG